MDLLGGALMMGAPPGTNPLISFMPIVAMLGIMYFLLVRPQQKEAKRHEQMVNALKKGDEVVTFGGLYGKIVGFNGDRVSLRVDEGVKVEIERSKVMRVVSGNGAERSEKPEKSSPRPA
jgi:preprotein translocase subunit YajC